MPSHEHPGNGESFSPAAGDYLSLSDRDLCSEIERMAQRERELSFQRRFVQGQIELAREELARRLTLDRPLNIDRDVLHDIETLLGPTVGREGA